MDKERITASEVPFASRAHKKSKRGCKTCKLRKIKCDETHPLCNNCHVYYQGKQPRCEYESSSTSTPQPQSSSNSSRAANQRRKRDRKGKDKDEGDVSPRASQEIVPSICPGAVGQSSLASAPSPEMLDPFHTHPPTPELEADELLQHYFQTTVYTIFPFYPSATINPQAEFYSPLIYTDALLYHVTLQLSVCHLEKLGRSRRKVQSKKLMGECLRLLRQRVESQEDGRGVSDETIAGVAGLVGIEHEKGNVRMVQLHMRGLQRMLDVRGGLNALRRSNGMIANIVFCTFAAAHDLPFPTADLTCPWPPPTWYIVSLPGFSPPCYKPFTAFGVPTPFADVLQNIRVLAGTYQQASDCTDSAHYLSVLVFLCATIQRAMSLPPVAIVDEESKRGYWLAEATRSALILHVFHLWCGRHTPDPSLLVSNARQNLKSALKQMLICHAPSTSSSILLRTNARAYELLLWFACVGAVGSSAGSAERNWFRGHVAVLCEEMQISRFDGVGGLKDVLRGVVWHELQDEVMHRVLWEEVEDMS